MNLSVNIQNKLKSKKINEYVIRVFQNVPHVRRVT